MSTPDYVQQLHDAVSEIDALAETTPGFRQLSEMSDEILTAMMTVWAAPISGDREANDRWQRVNSKLDNLRQKASASFSFEEIQLLSTLVGRLDDALGRRSDLARTLELFKGDYQAFLQSRSTSSLVIAAVTAARLRHSLSQTASAISQTVDRLHVPAATLKETEEAVEFYIDVDESLPDIARRIGAISDAMATLAGIQSFHENMVRLVEIRLGSIFVRVAIPKQIAGLVKWFLENARSSIRRRTTTNGKLELFVQRADLLRSLQQRATELAGAGVDGTSLSDAVQANVEKLAKDLEVLANGAKSVSLGVGPTVDAESPALPGRTSPPLLPPGVEPLDPIR
ncbi:MAG: hypothetical protein QM783_10555 [Phycisphaerales bacterium]